MRDGAWIKDTPYNLSGVCEGLHAVCDCMHLLRDPCIVSSVK